LRSLITRYEKEKYVVRRRYFTPEGTPTLMLWWVLGGKVILTTMLPVVYLLVRPPIPDQSKVITETKTLYWSSRLGVGRGAYAPKPYKICSVEKLLKLEVGWKKQRWLESVEEDLKKMRVINWRCQS
jgi:hypothetical protein